HSELTLRSLDNVFFPSLRQCCLLVLLNQSHTVNYHHQLQFSDRLVKFVCFKITTLVSANVPLNQKAVTLFFPSPRGSDGEPADTLLMPHARWLVHHSGVARPRQGLHSLHRRP